MKDLYIGDSVKKIGRNAFDRCKSLTSVVLPNSVEFLGEKAFKDGRSLAKVKLSKSLKAPEPNSIRPGVSDLAI